MENRVVWLLWKSVDYCNPNLWGIFSSKKKAQKRMSSIREKRFHYSLDQGVCFEKAEKRADLYIEGFYVEARFMN